MSTKKLTQSQLDRVFGGEAGIRNTGLTFEELKYGGKAIGGLMSPLEVLGVIRRERKYMKMKKIIKTLGDEEE